jgi:hypothetical protein
MAQTIKELATAYNKPVGCSSLGIPLGRRGSLRSHSLTTLTQILARRCGPKPHQQATVRRNCSQSNRGIVSGIGKKRSVMNGPAILGTNEDQAFLLFYQEGRETGGEKQKSLVREENYFERRSFKP